MKSKVAGYILIVAALFYILAEVISATFFNDFFINTYIFHTISELGIPNSNSPLSGLMNFAFVFMGLSLIFSYFFKFKDYISINRFVCSFFTLITGFGVIIVALVHGGNPLIFTYHALGAIMAIFGGNILLVFISRSMAVFKIYQKFTLILGVLGLVAFVLMLFNFNSVFMPVFERFSVYTLIIWSFLTGMYLTKH